jgi:hypothetical protein
VKMERELPQTLALAERSGRKDCQDNLG